MLSALESCSVAFFASFSEIASRAVLMLVFIFFLQASLIARRRALVRRAFLPADSCGIGGVSQIRRILSNIVLSLVEETRGISF